MDFIWKKEFESGNSTVDRQHKQLIVMYKKFTSACAAGRSAAELEEMLKFLIECTIKHFNDEEVWQRQIKYPDHLKHKLLHETFRQTAATLYLRLKREGSTTVIIEQLNKEIVEWMINHITNEDVETTKYVRKLAG